MLICVFCLFPFYWLINVSLKSGADLAQADLIPPNPSLDNYDSIFKNSDFTSALRNSVIVTTITTALALLVGSFAAYALARLRFPMKFLILAVVLSITTFPPIAIAAPIFKLWTDIGLYDTYAGLIIPYLTFALPWRFPSSPPSSRRSRRSWRRRPSWTERPISRPFARSLSRWPRRVS